MPRVEWLLGIVIALLLMVAAVPGVRIAPSADATARGLEGLLLLARDEAVQTGDPHIVSFHRGDRGPGGRFVGGANDDRAAPVMASLFRDRDGDGRPSESEYVAGIAADANGPLRWGSSLATGPADGDPSSLTWNPTQHGSSVARRALVFRSDGVPYSVSPSSDAARAAGSGAGAVYLHSPARDYAVVLSPWGDVDLRVWDSRSESWKPASAR